jgi:hypothetical protein
MMILILGCASAIEAQQEQAVPRSPAPQSAGLLTSQLAPRALEAFTRVPLSVPPFGYFGTLQCDASGTMFFEAGLPQNARAYLSISRDGQKQTIYSLPKDVTDQPHNTTFYASSDGELHLLVIQPGVGVKDFRFDPDGKLEGVTNLDAPSGILVKGFAVTSQGYILLLGFYPAPDNETRDAGATYRAIFKPSGALVTNLPNSREPGIDDTVNSLSEGHIEASGEDFYWTTGNSILTMDTAGNIIHKLEIHKPNENDALNAIFVSGGMLAVGLLATGEHPLQYSYLVLGAATGDPYGLYLPPTGARHLACFDSKQGFTFLAVDHGHLNLVQALLP